MTLNALVRTSDGNRGRITYIWGDGWYTVDCGHFYGRYPHNRLELDR